VLNSSVYSDWVICFKAEISVAFQFSAQEQMWIVFSASRLALGLTQPPIQQYPTFFSIMCTQRTTCRHAVTRLGIRGAANPLKLVCLEWRLSTDIICCLYLHSCRGRTVDLLLVLDSTVEGVDTHNRPLKLKFRDSGEGEINPGNYCHLLFWKILYFHVFFKCKWCTPSRTTLTL